MKNPTRVSIGQLSTLAFNLCVGAGMLWLLGATSRVAERDAWLAILLSLALGLPTVALYISFASLAPTKTPVGVYLQVWGRWLGRLPALLLMLQTIFAGATMLYWLSELFSSVIMPETPMVVFAGSLALLTLQIERGGYEQGARWSTLAAVLIVGYWLLMVIGLWPTAQGVKLLPIMGQGPTPLIRATIIAYSGMTLQLPILLFYLPQVKERQRIGRSLSLALLAATLLVTILVMLLTTNIGGYLLGVLTHPLMTGVQNIDLGIVYERLDLAAIMLWVLAFTANFSLCLQAATVGLAEILKLREYIGLLPAMVGLFVAVALSLYDDYFAAGEAILNQPGSAIAVCLVLPALTVVVGKIKGRLRSPKG